MQEIQILVDPKENPSTFTAQNNRSRNVCHHWVQSVHFVTTFCRHLVTTSFNLFSQDEVQKDCHKYLSDKYFCGSLCQQARLVTNAV